MIRRWEARQVGKGKVIEYPLNHHFFLKCNAVRRVKHNNDVVQAMESTKKLVHYKYVVVDRRTDTVVE